MQLTSDAFSHNQPIPEKHSAYGANVSPQLTWTEPPPGTKSFALVVEDPDAPRPTPFVHWVAFNIPADCRTFHEGRIAPGAVQGVNDAGTGTYFGPKPPSGVHRYFFRLFALDLRLDLDAGVGYKDFIRAAEGHVLGRAEIIGTYAR